MAATSFWYGNAVLNQWGTTAANQVQWTGDTLQVTLHSNTYSPAQDTHDFFDDATNELGTAGGYTAGGVTLSGKTATYDGPTNTVRLKANDVTWTAFDPTTAARYAVFWKNTAGAASTDPLIGYMNFGADQDPGGLDFTVKGDATDGFFRAVVS